VITIGHTTLTERDIEALAQAARKAEVEEEMSSDRIDPEHPEFERFVEALVLVRDAKSFSPGDTLVISEPLYELLWEQLQNDERWAAFLRARARAAKLGLPDALRPGEPISAASFDRERRWAKREARRCERFACALRDLLGRALVHGYEGREA
jgi:hypothetical protein